MSSPSAVSHVALSYKSAFEMIHTRIKVGRPYTIIMMCVDHRNNMEEAIHNARDMQQLNPSTHIILVTPPVLPEYPTVHPKVDHDVNWKTLAKPIRREKLIEILPQLPVERPQSPIKSISGAKQQDSKAGKKEIPVLRASKDKEETKRKDATEEESSTRPRILVVEDNRINQKVVLAQLAKLKCKSELAINGAIAVDMIKRTPHFALVLMDLAMPVMDGFEATEVIRGLSDSYFKTVPIVALTASITDSDRERCERVGMFDVLMKPVKVNQLHIAIQKWCPGSLTAADDGGEKETG